MHAAIWHHLVRAGGSHDLAIALSRLGFLVGFQPMFWLWDVIRIPLGYDYRHECCCWHRLLPPNLPLF